MKKRLLATLICLVMITAVLAGCGGGSMDASPPQAAALLATPAPPAVAQVVGGEPGLVPMGGAVVQPPLQIEAAGDVAVGAPPIITPSQAGGRMFVYTIDYRLQTTAFMPGVRTLLDIVAAHGGHTLRARMYGYDLRHTHIERRAYFRFRVPSENIPRFIEELERNFNILLWDLHAVEETRRYDNHLIAAEYARERFARLLEALEEAQTTSERLNIERQITAAQNDMRVYEAAIAAIEDNVLYSDITVFLQEVILPGEVEPEPDMTFSQQLVETLNAAGLGLLRILQGAALFFIAAIPVIVPMAAIAFAVWRIHRYFTKRKKNETDNNDEN